MPRHFAAFQSVLPCREIAMRTGALNLAKYFPPYFCIPDLGPKMYIAYGWLEEFIHTPRYVFIEIYIFYSPRYYRLNRLLSGFLINRNY